MVPGRGRLIAIEGSEASGKSTQAGYLAGALGATLTREPGGTAVGEAIRELLLHGPTDLEPKAEALLVVAARAQHAATVIGPALAAGDWVVSDRYSASSLAYQGYGRGLDLDDVRWLSSWASGGIWPDLTILLEVPAEEVSRRRPDSRDRFESAGSGFHERVARGYRRLAEAEGWAVIDGMGPPDEVGARVLEVVLSRLGRPDTTLAHRSGG